MTPGATSPGCGGCREGVTVDFLPVSLQPSAIRVMASSYKLQPSPLYRPILHMESGYTSYIGPQPRVIFAVSASALGILLVSPGRRLQ